MKDKEELYSIFQQYLNGKSKPEELDQMLNDLMKQDENQSLKGFIAEHLGSDDEFDENIKQRIAVVLSHTDENMVNFVNDRLRGHSNLIKYIKRWLPHAVAVLLISIALGLYVYNVNRLDSQEFRLAAGVSIGPIGNKATLTLADGSVVELSDRHEGIIVGEDNILYNDSSVILNKQEYLSNTTESGKQGLLPAANLTLTTPKGGRYRVILADGTKVWLNAGSTLKYPSRFTKSERRVDLEGEAYFEVASKVVSHVVNGVPNGVSEATKSPFIITSGMHEVRVLGTHFNISAYRDESETRTTLVEGAVEVAILTGTGERSLRHLLKPNEQSIITAGSKNISIRAVNTYDYTAWRESLLVFDKRSLKSILLTLSRWYDFKVDITKIPDISLSGAIPANVKLSEVLALLEETSKVKLKVERTNAERGRRVTISR